MGDLIRVFEKAPKAKSSDLLDVENLKELFHVFFPLGPALKQKIFERVRNCPLPQSYHPPKQMKTPFEIDHNENILSWSIFDLSTGKQKVVKKLSKTQLKYSPYEIWNDTLIIQAIKEEWTPDNLRPYM